MKQLIKEFFQKTLIEIVSPIFTIFKRPYLWVTVLWLAVIGLQFIWADKFIIVNLLFFTVTGYIPILYFVICFSRTKIGKVIKKSLKLWHWAIALSFFVFVFSQFSIWWSSKLINSIFFVDPSNFPITQTILSVIFAPLVFYINDYFSIIYVIVIRLLPFMFSFLGLGLLLNAPMKNILSYMFNIFAIIPIVTFVAVPMLIFKDGIKLWTRELAFLTDFNSKFYCKDPWKDNADSLVFLGGNRVLVRFKKSKETKILTCSYK